MPSLLQRLRERVPLTFAEFMAAALYDPAEGYYGAGRARLGRTGDFFTSVSVGPLFGRLLARQFEEMHAALDGPEGFTLVEQGAHDGTLAADVLGALSGPLAYCIIEPSEHWQQVQREKLAGFRGVRWVREPSDLSGIEGVFFSNELLDALPVHRLRRRAGEWHEQYVVWNQDRFAFAEGRLSDPALAGEIPLPLPEGYTTEVRPVAAKWLCDTASALTRGWILALDYGFVREEYYRPERVNGTLTGYANHRQVDDPLQSPGEIDLTAHVDFTSLIEATSLDLMGFTDQQHFMAGLGGLYFQDTESVSLTRAKEQRAFMTLMHPGLMGAAFKAICFAKGTSAPLAGFRFAGRST